MKKKTIAAVVAGTAVGAGLGVLFAPKSGKETREDLKKKIEEVREHLKNISAKDVKTYVEEKITKIEQELKELDKEKVLKIAKSKAKKIENEVQKLGRYVKDKSEPVLESAVNSMREKTVDVIKNVLDKLENK